MRASLNPQAMSINAAVVGDLEVTGQTSTGAPEALNAAAATVVADCSLSNGFVVTQSGAGASTVNFINAVTGQEVTVVIVSSVAQNMLFNLNGATTNLKAVGGSGGALATASGRWVVKFYFDGTNMNEVSRGAAAIS